MRNLRITIDEKVADESLSHKVGIGYALVRAQVLEPRVRQECLDKSPILSGILKESPVVSAIAAALAGIAPQRLQKRQAVLRIDVVFHRYQYGASVRLHFVRGDGSSPMHGWREVDCGAGLQFPAPGQRDCDQCACRRGEKSRRHAGKRSNLSPESAAEAHCTKKHRHEDSKSTAAHPFGESELRGPTKRFAGCARVLTAEG